MKPSWEEAPEWASYLAQDRDGEWYWYENKPEPITSCEWFDVLDDSRAEIIGRVNEKWQETLEIRPG